MGSRNSHLHIKKQQNSLFHNDNDDPLFFPCPANIVESFRELKSRRVELEATNKQLKEKNRKQQEMDKRLKWVQIRIQEQDNKIRALEYYNQHHLSEKDDDDDDDDWETAIREMLYATTTTTTTKTTNEEDSSPQETQPDDVHDESVDPLPRPEPLRRRVPSDGLPSMEVKKKNIDCSSCDSHTTAVDKTSPPPTTTTQQEEEKQEKASTPVASLGTLQQQNDALLKLQKRLSLLITDCLQREEAFMMESKRRESTLERMDLEIAKMVHRVTLSMPNPSSLPTFQEMDRQYYTQHGFILLSPEEAHEMETLYPHLLNLEKENTKFLAATIPKHSFPQQESLGNVYNRAAMRWKQAQETFFANRFRHDNEQHWSVVKKIKEMMQEYREWYWKHYVEKEMETKEELETIQQRLEHVRDAERMATQDFCHEMAVRKAYFTTIQQRISTCNNNNNETSSSKP